MTFTKEATMSKAREKKAEQPVVRHLFLQNSGLDRQ